nr:MAG: hypothetical protein [Metapenaeus ensis nimavirus]
MYDLDFDQLKEARNSLMIKFEAIQMAYEKVEALDPFNDLSVEYDQCERDTVNISFDIKERCREFTQVSRDSICHSCTSTTSSQDRSEFIKNVAKLNLDVMTSNDEAEKVKVEAETGKDANNSVMNEVYSHSRIEYTRDYVSKLSSMKTDTIEPKVEDIRDRVKFEVKQESNLNPRASSFRPRDELKDAIEHLADILSVRQRSDTLPRLEPEVFKGDILQYPKWNKAFETLVESKTNSASERLYYIGKYTDGEAKEAISSLLSLDTTEAYNDARELLKQRYGDVFTIAQAYRKKLDEWPKVSINNGSALMKFSDYLQNCKTAMNL